MNKPGKKGDGNAAIPADNEYAVDPVGVDTMRLRPS